MISYEQLLEACKPGGASVLTSITELQPAAGTHSSVAPAKFVERGNSVFAFETRFIEGEAKETVLIDSKQSQLNRTELALQADIDAGHLVISKMPRISVDYGDEKLTDLQLSHRFSDGHFRAATIDGQPASADERYRSIRNATVKDLSPVLSSAPVAALMGAWDSTRATNQLRLPSCLVGEIIGVLADQSRTGEAQQSLRGGARVDSVGMSVQLSAEEMKKLLDAQRDDLSPKLVDKIEDSIKKAKKSHISGSVLGLGGIPPALESLGGVSCQRIIRSWVLSFAGLRQLSFGKGAEENAVGRALLAALGLASIARAEQELYVRANCHLVEKAAPVVTLDCRYGETKTLDPITVEEADALLLEAIEAARDAGVADWQGQVLEMVGNPIIRGAATEEAAQGE